MESSTHNPSATLPFATIRTLMLICTALCLGCSDDGGGDGGAEPGSVGGTGGLGAPSMGAGGGGVTGGGVGPGGVGGETTEPWVEPTFDPNSLPTSIPLVEIVVAEADLAALDAAPFYGEDVVGAFVDAEGVRHEQVDVNYRGAYALLELIESDPLGRRNFKLKFPSEDRYQERREWNYTFSPSLRQLLAYDLMRYSGVRVPSARHVRLSVNGEAMGLYLEYEDPDSKDWLFDMFGDRTGDLYKAARDMPASEGQPEQKFFADTTYLGADDAAYLYHYNKKTNHEDPAIAGDFSVLRGFLEELNRVTGEELLTFASARFELDRFLSYLVVSNFIANWDGFPQRPKNYWLFEVRNQGKLAFIPWDLDGTFQTDTDVFNQMGTEASVFFNLRQLDYEPYHTEEGTERPLAWRLLALPELEAAYRARYRELLGSILSESYLSSRIAALAALTEPHLSEALTGQGWLGEERTERGDFDEALRDMQAFVTARVATVSAELASLP